jgi:recombination protein RecA
MAKSKSSRADLQEDLVDILVSSLNTGAKGEYIPHAQKLEDNETVEYVSTGCSLLDMAIANKRAGGYPVGKIVELMGLEGSGKSLLAAHAIAETQKLGGIGVFIDTEHAVNAEFFEVLGVDRSKMLYVSAETIEECFETMERIITVVKQSEINSKEKRQVTIVLDSIAGASTKPEMSADFDKDGYATQKAIILSKGWRKITNLIGREKVCVIVTNQLRQKVNALAFSDPWTTSGGKSTAFHSSVRIRLSSVGKIKVKNSISGKDEVVGIKTKAHIIKNRQGPPNKEVHFDIYYDSGLDETGGILQTLKDFKIVKSAGAWYTYVSTSTGEELKFQSKDFHELILNQPDIHEELMKKIEECSTLKYRQNIDGGIDDVIVEPGISE